MPTNVSPEYKKAEEAYRAAREPKERLDCLKEMLRTIPKHKGTEHLQSDIKQRIKALTEDPGGDIRAVKGTKVNITITTDKPLVDGVLVIGENAITIRDNKGVIEVADDGEYHIAARYEGENIRLTDDFFRAVEEDRDWEAKTTSWGGTAAASTSTFINSRTMARKQ